MESKTSKSEGASPESPKQASRARVPGEGSLSATSAKRGIDVGGGHSEKRPRLVSGHQQTGASEKRPRTSLAPQQVDAPGVEHPEVSKARDVKPQKKLEPVWSATDNFASELTQILDRRGGVSSVPHVARLETLMADEQRLNYRWTLLTIIELSSEECLRAVVRGPGLQCLERWMIEARDAGKTEFLTKIISRLEHLPVDFESLKRCTIGKTVGSLRKHFLPNVKASATRVVQKWKSALGDQYAGSKKERDSKKDTSSRKKGLVKDTSNEPRGTATSTQKEPSPQQQKACEPDVEADSKKDESPKAAQSSESEQTGKDESQCKDKDPSGTQTSESCTGEELERAPNISSTKDSQKEVENLQQMQSKDSSAMNDMNTSEQQQQQDETPKVTHRKSSRPSDGGLPRPQVRAQPTWQEVSRAVNFGRNLVAESVQRAQMKGASTIDSERQVSTTEASDHSEVQGGNKAGTHQESSNGAAHADGGVSNGLVEAHSSSKQPLDLESRLQACDQGCSAEEVQAVGKQSENKTEKDMPAVSNGADAPSAPDIPTIQDDGTTARNPVQRNNRSADTNPPAVPISSASGPRVPRPWPSPDSKQENKAGSSDVTELMKPQSPFKGLEPSMLTNPYQEAMAQLTRQGLSIRSGSSRMVPARLGGLNSDFLPHRSSGVTTGAAARAATAAAQHPSPQWRIRNPSTRKVCFAPDSELLTIRWFKKSDPPARVKEDSFLTREEFQEEKMANHELFESAARLEHKKEHEALERQRQVLAAKRKETQERLNAMKPTTAWHPPIRINLPDDWKMKFGEESNELIMQQQRDDKIVPETYSRVSLIPDSPAEAPSPSLTEGHHEDPVVIPLHVPTFAKEQPVGPSPDNEPQPPLGPQQGKPLSMQQGQQIHCPLPLPGPNTGAQTVAVLSGEPLGQGLPATQFAVGQVGQQFRVQGVPGGQTVVVLQPGTQQTRQAVEPGPQSAVPNMGTVLIAGPPVGMPGLVQIAGQQQWGAAQQPSLFPQFAVVDQQLGGPGPAGFPVQPVVTARPLINNSGVPAALLNGNLAVPMVRSGQSMEQGACIGQPGGPVQAQRFQR